jgi:hypothetical protein
MRRCPDCGAESLSDEEEATASRSIMGAVVISELELAITHRAPDRLTALLDEKLANLRASLLDALQAAREQRA